MFACDESQMLELVGRTDIPVFRGAELPLVRRKAETEIWEQRYGSVAWLGAWTPRFYHPPDQLGEMPEGKPTTKAQKDVKGASFAVNMGDMLNNVEIQQLLGPDLTLHFLSLYADPRGINLRNRIAHGLIRPESVTQFIANWVIHSLLVLGVWDKLGAGRR